MHDHRACRCKSSERAIALVDPETCYHTAGTPPVTLYSHLGVHHSLKTMHACTDEQMSYYIQSCCPRILKFDGLVSWHQPAMDLSLLDMPYLSG
jgi:hypothetical protein